MCPAWHGEKRNVMLFHAHDANVKPPQGEYVKIKKIETMRMNMPRKEPKTKPRRASWADSAEVANPMSKFPEFKRIRDLWMPTWEGVWVKVDGRGWDVGRGPLFLRPAGGARSSRTISPSTWWARTAWPSSAAGT